MEILEKASRYKYFILFSGILVALLALVNFSGLISQFQSFEMTPEGVKSAVLSLGVFAPFGMIFFEWLQVVAAPIPPVTMVASGFTFGIFPGSIYSWVGMSLGSFTALLLGRKFGRPVVEKVVSEDHIERFNHLTEEHGLIVFTTIFVLPGFPDDVVCYLAGLTDLDLKKLAVSASLGRIPTVITLVVAGNSMAMSQNKLMVAILAIFIGTGAICVKKEEKIIEVASRWEKSLASSVSGIRQFWP